VTVLSATLDGNSAYGVFFENEYKYVVVNPNDKFFSDVQNQSVRSSKLNPEGIITSVYSSRLDVEKE